MTSDVSDSTALKSCYVASGSLDVFVDTRSQTLAVDRSATMHILREAGGLMTGLYGASLNMKLSGSEPVAFVAVANLRLYTEILRTL